MENQTKIKDFLNLDFDHLQPKANETRPQSQEVRIFGEVWENSLYLLDEQLKANENQPLELLINSPGGSVFDGVAMASLIKRHKGQTTATGLGFVASIASVILLAADKVRLNKDAFLMIHNAWSFDAGEAEDLRKTADLLEKISNQIAEVYLDQLKKNDKLINGDIKETRASIKQMMSAETWLTADEALKLGFIDEIADDAATLEPLTEEQLKNIVNKYRAKAPKTFLNMATLKDTKETQETKDAENEASFWDKLKALFAANPEKLKEFKNESDEETVTEETETDEDEKTDEEKEKEELEAAKTLLTEAGYTVLEKEEQEQAKTESEALQNAANLSKEENKTLQNNYDSIMSKLKEFEKEFSGPSSITKLENKEEKPKEKNSIDAILEELNEGENVKDSKFFKMLNQ